MAFKNTKMAFIMKENLVKIKDTEQENFSIKIKLCIWDNGKRVNFMEKESFFIT